MYQKDMLLTMYLINKIFETIVTQFKFSRIMKISIIQMGKYQWYYHVNHNKVILQANRLLKENITFEQTSYNNCMHNIFVLQVHCFKLNPIQPQSCSICIPIIKMQ